MLENERNLAELQGILENLKGPNNFIVEKLVSRVDDLIEEQKSLEEELKTTTEEYNNNEPDGRAKKRLDETINKFLASVPKELKVSFDERFRELGKISFSEYAEDFELSSTMDAKARAEETAYLKNKKKELEEKVKALKDNLEVQEALLEAAKEVRDKLNEYTELSNKGELDLSKKEMIDFIGQICDENGRPLFNEDELSVIAQIIMFSENFEFVEEKGMSTRDLVRGALEQEDEETEEKVDESAPTVEETEDIEKTTLQGIKVDSLEEELFSVSDNMDLEMMGTTPVSEYKPSDDYNPADPFSLIADLEKDETLLHRYQESDKIYENMGITPEVSPRSYQMNETQRARYTENMAYLKRQGVEGGEAKCPVTFGMVDPKEVEQTMMMAYSYGIQPRNYVEAAKLCSTPNIELYFDELVEKVQDEYDTYAKHTPVAAIVAASKNLELRKEETNNFLRNYITRPQLLDGINDFVEDPILASEDEELMLEVLTKLNGVRKRYAYLLGSEYVSAGRVSRNIKKILASEESQGLSAEEIAFIACIYDGTKNKEQILEVRSSIVNLMADRNFGGPAL